MNAVLGFDTSCYTSSAAVVDCRGRVLVSRRMMLPVDKGKRGLRQSEAVFAHVRQLPQVFCELMENLNGVTLCAVSASQTPRAEVGSYMPVFTVGYGHAKATASVLGIPYYGVSHQEGHIAAGQIGNPPLSKRFVAAHISGGTTELLLQDEGALIQLGGTLDLNAGQLVDRIGVMMGLPFPAGPSLEALAIRCDYPAQSLLPLSMAGEDLYCHFSGAETRAMQLYASGILSKERLALEVYDLLARTMTRMLRAALCKTNSSQALMVGGVASSILLRTLFFKRFEKRGIHAEVIFGQPDYSADNAAGVALLGAMRHFNF